MKAGRTAVKNSHHKILSDEAEACYRSAHCPDAPLTE